MTISILASPIEFEGMKGVGNVHLTFKDDQCVYAMIGENGVGKTKCLESLFQLLCCASETIYQSLGSNVYDVQLNFSFVNKIKDKMIFNNYIQSNHNKFFLTKNMSINDYFEAHQMPFVFLGSQNRGYVSLKESYEIKHIRSFEQRKTKYFQDLSNAMINGFSSLNMDTDISAWFIIRAQSSNPYQAEKDNRKVEIDTVLQLLNQIDEKISPTFLEISGDGRVFLEINQEKRGLDELSSGYASILKIIQAIIAGYAYFTNETHLQNIRGIVLIDEIESHLHMKWQSNIILLLKKLFPNTIFYITTHSSIVLTQLEQGEAYRLERDKSDGIVKTHLIEHPNKAAFVDILKEAFNLDVNQLKLERMSTDQQKEAKEYLLSLLSPKGDK